MHGRSLLSILPTNSTEGLLQSFRLLRSGSIHTHPNVCLMLLLIMVWLLRLGMLQISMLCRVFSCTRMQTLQQDWLQ